MKNLFIARTPLQLFNCLEARERFHAKDENILFYHYQREVDKKLMEQLINSSEWKEVIAYPLNARSKLLFPLYLSKVKRKYLGKIENCYFGIFNSIVAHLINSISPKHLFIVDDGTKTLGIARNLEAQIAQKRNLFKTIRNKFLKSGREFLYDSSFFSIYTLENYKIENKVILNDYRCFKLKLEKVQSKDVVYFIGTNLNEKILKSDEVFEPYIEKIVNFYQNRRLIYILHRYEKMEYVERLAKKYGFECVKFDNILEAQIAKEGFLPSEFATFGSSAIETLPLLYDKSCYTIFEIASVDILEHRVEAMEKLYLSFRDKGYVIHSL